MPSFKAPSSGTPHPVCSLECKVFTGEVLIRPPPNIISGISDLYQSGKGKALVTSPGTVGNAPPAGGKGKGPLRLFGKVRKCAFLGRVTLTARRATWVSDLPEGSEGDAEDEPHECPEEKEEVEGEEVAAPVPMEEDPSEDLIDDSSIPEAASPIGSLVVPVPAHVNPPDAVTDISLRL